MTEITNQKVKIHLKSVTTEEGNGSSTFRASYDGSYSEKNGRCFLLYGEKTESGNKQKTIITIEKEQIRIHRRGETESSMVFEARKEYPFIHQTQGMSFDMSTYTLHLSHKKSKDGGEIFIQYQLLYNEQKIGSTEMTITYETN